jgi:hypothetical protein
VSQVIRGGPFQVIDRRDHLWFQPATLLHLGGRQSFAPLTATRLGQVRERTSLRFEPMGSLENRRSQSAIMSCDRPWTHRCKVEESSLNQVEIHCARLNQSREADRINLADAAP